MNYLSNYSTIVAELIVHELVLQGVTSFIVSPGKRDIPLLNAITRRNSELQIIESIDERSASFLALGIAQQYPVAIVCTSGTALTHYAAAIEEAKRQGRKLLILSADRPLNLIHSNANQTLEQYNYFSLPKERFLQLETPSSSVPPRSISSRVAHITYQIKQNYVCHINVPLIEPLDYRKVKIDPKWQDEAKSILKEKDRYTVYTNITTLQFESILTSKSAIIVGEVNSTEMVKQVNKLITTTNCPLFSDITSSCYQRYNSFHPDKKSFEKLIKEKKIDHIIHIGKRVTSNKYYRLLSNYNIPITHIDHEIEFLQDPSFQVRELICCKKFNNTAIKRTKKAYAFSPKSTQLHHYNISDVLWNHIPSSESLLIANSTVIRSFDYITKKERKAPLYFQRGISGIDGNIAHAMGIALTGQSVSLLLGDIALLHDIGSLINLKDLPINLTIYVYNNNSGAIFNLLNIEASEQTKEIISSRHQTDFAAILSAINISYSHVVDVEQLTKICRTKSNGIRFIEIRSSSLETKKVFEKFIQE